VSGVLLDTHAWVWWATAPDRLSRAQRRAIDSALDRNGARLLISIISCWEVALLAQHRRLRFTVPVDAWLGSATAVPGLEVVPLSLPIVLAASRLTALRDPADMLIVASALVHGVPLVTSDERIEAAKLVRVVA
jgi:PIN domain nuclease of toxin-antitoxin system